jgi:hypothetical protein
MIWSTRIPPFAAVQHLVKPDMLDGRKERSFDSFSARLGVAQDFACGTLARPFDKLSAGSRPQNGSRWAPT